MKTRKLLSLSVCLFPAALGVACGGASDNLPPPPPPPAPPPVASAQVTPTTSTAGVEAAPPPAPVQLSEGVASPDPPSPTPTVKIVAPSSEQIIAAAKAADFDVKLDVKNWKTGKGDAHVHLILDNKPYKPIYDTKAPVKLLDLSGGEALAEGQHVLVAFPSRANHESVKTPGSLAIIQFWVGKKGEKALDVKKPMLIYSRPKGEYKAEMANHVLVDFQLANDTLATDKDHVHLSVTGPGIDGEKSADVAKLGAPFYLDGLHDGSYSLKLELVGADGMALPGSWNSTSRAITIAH